MSDGLKLWYVLLCLLTWLNAYMDKNINFLINLHYNLLCKTRHHWLLKMLHL